jgi:hypothetical protein
MNFKHLRMLNYSSKCLKITLKVNKFSKPENKFPQKTEVEGDIPLESFEEGGLFPSGGNPGGGHPVNRLSTFERQII